jgi:hypothetical protein
MINRKQQKKDAEEDVTQLSPVLSMSGIYNDPKLLFDILHICETLESDNIILDAQFLTKWKLLVDAWTKKFKIEHDDFYSQLFIELSFEIYYCFNLWIACKVGDLEYTKKYSHKIGILETVEDLAWNDSNSLDYGRLEFSKRIMRRIVDIANDGMYQLHLYIRYDPDKNKAEFMPLQVHPNILEIIYYQFSLLILGNLARIKHCTKCTRIFVYDHANTDLCDVCKRDYHRDDMRVRRLNAKNKTRLPTH